jgi:hypothetical protein
MHLMRADHGPLVHLGGVTDGSVDDRALQLRLVELQTRVGLALTPEEGAGDVSRLREVGLYLVVIRGGKEGGTVCHA